MIWMIFLQIPISEIVIYNIYYRIEISSLNIVPSNLEYFVVEISSCIKKFVKFISVIAE